MVPSNFQMNFNGDFIYQGFLCFDLFISFILGGFDDFFGF